jgi:hypothetical protein
MCFKTYYNFIFSLRYNNVKKTSFKLRVGTTQNFTYFMKYLGKKKKYRSKYYNLIRN